MDSVLESQAGHFPSLGLESPVKRGISLVIRVPTSAHPGLHPGGSNLMCLSSIRNLYFHKSSQSDPDTQLGLGRPGWSLKSPPAVKMLSLL